MSNGTDDPATNGEWLGPVRTPGYSSNDPTNPDDEPDGVFAVHAVQLHTGRVLFFSGYFESQGYSYRSWEFDPAVAVAAFDTDKDPADEAHDDAIGRWFVPGFEGEGEPTIDDDEDIDLFCSHHVALPDGRILVVGGDAEERVDGHDNRGLHIYDPLAHEWTDVPHRMAAGRWYPSAVAMPDGQVAIFSGHSEPGMARADWPDDEPPLNFHHNHFADVEIVGPRQFDPEIVTGADRGLYMYPGLVLVKGRKVYSVPTTWNDDTDTGPLETEYFQLTGESSGTWTPADPSGLLPDHPYRQDGTFVLLPPAREGRILVIGGYDQVNDTARKSCDILETQGDPEQWIDAGEMNHARANVSAVLLPTGEVLIVGGHDGDPESHGAGTPQLTPEIYDPNVEYDPADPTAAFRTVADMDLSRMYHATVLLLPDGRVLTAGGYGVPGHGGGGPDQQQMEFYEPPYLHTEGDQPVITGVSGRGPDGEEVRHGGTLTVDYETPGGDEIETVALMRPGSITHHTDTEQRYVDLDFFDEDGELRAQVPGDTSVLPPGYYMLWLVDAEGRPCEEAEFVRLSERTCSLVTDRSHFSAAAYDAKATGDDDTVEFHHSLYVVLHGFVPRDVGIHTATPSDAELRAFAPDVSVLEDGETVLGVAADPEADGMYLEDPDDSLEARQRITFEYKVRVGSAAAFPSSDGDGTAERDLQLQTTFEGFTCEGDVTLVSSPNPYMLDGDPHWLSTDLRTFQVEDGGSTAGVGLSAADTPFDYLEDFLDACRSAGDGPGNPFEALPTTMGNAELELAPQVDGTRVLNFAVARVHLQAPPDVTASDVHLFFRLFVTEQPTLPYHHRAFPRSEGSPAYARVGTTPGEIITIPFYGTERADVDSEPYDDRNIQDMSGEADGEAVHYFGAWLDINKPSREPLTDPSSGESRAVQDLIRGRHQCMVGEIFFEGDEIPVDATPANNDNLAQRNLAIVDSDNPGGPDAHTVQHTFNVKPTWGKHLFQEPGDLDPPEMLTPPRHLKQESVEPRPDELAIFWGDLPRDARAELYFPALDADEIVELSRLEGRAGALERVGPHTVACPIADVSDVPLPAEVDDDLTGLIDVQLPEDVEAGQKYRIVVRHHSRMKGRMEGSFELLVPVEEGATFRTDAERDLAIFRHVAGTLPADSRWEPVLERYIEGLAGRVAGVGGDPSTIGPSPTGPERTPERPPESRIRDLIECLMQSDSIADALDRHDVDPDELRRCLDAVEGGAYGRSPDDRSNPIGTTARTGENCPESGVWQVADGTETAPIAEGDRMPPYDDEAVTWRLVQYA